MAVSTRRIVLINVTTNPTLDWVKQQIRTVAAFGEGPRYLIHDNDGIFGQFRERQAGRCFRCHFDRWLFQVMGIKGIPIPYGAPNANARVERFHRTLREAALDHFIFFSERHVCRICREFVEYYNRARPSQAIGTGFQIRIRSFRSLRRGRGSWSRYRCSADSSTTIDWRHRQVREHGRVRGSGKGGWRRHTLRPAISELIEHFSG